MICVECTNPDIKCLYSRFKSKYIKLTVCSKCGNLADKYIEFDNVLVFLDVLLLKAPAYRHVAYNLVESAIFGHAEDDDGAPASLKPPSYRPLARYFVLSILFEVYLKWAYEERSSQHTLMMGVVLGYADAWQYFYFITSLLVERVTFCGLLYLMFRHLLNWGLKPNQNLPAHLQRLYYICVLNVAIFLSLVVKCLPIVMLIWPYDNATIASTVVDVFGVFTTIEALKMIANSSYISTSIIVAMATVALVAVKQLVMSALVAYIFEDFSCSVLFQNEIQRVLGEFNLLRELFHASLRELY